MDTGTRRMQRLRNVSAPCRHVREICDNQVDLSVGHLVSRKTRHLHRGPTANRFRGTNEGAESVPCHVLRRIHRPIEIRPVSRLANFSKSDVSVFSGSGNHRGRDLDGAFSVP